MNGREREKYPQLDSYPDEMIRLLLLTKSMSLLEEYVALEKSGTLAHIVDGKRDAVGGMLAILPQSVTQLELHGVSESRSREAIQKVPEHMREQWKMEDLNSHITKLRSKFMTSPRRNP